MAKDLTQAPRSYIAALLRSHQIITKYSENLVEFHSLSPSPWSPLRSISLRSEVPLAVTAHRTSAHLFMHPSVKDAAMYLLYKVFGVEWVIYLWRVSANSMPLAMCLSVNDLVAMREVDLG
jgi:hypothetical protein